MSQSCGQPVQVSAAPKQGAPWQFNNLQCHLGAITLPLGTVIVIISGRTTFSMLITRYRSCTSLPGAVSSFLNVMLLHIRDIFTPSRYHLPALITVIICVVSRLRSESDSRLTFSLWALSSDKRSHLFPKSIHRQDFVIFALISVSDYLFHLHAHYKAAVTANNYLFSAWKLQIIVCPPPHHWTK